MHTAVLFLGMSYPSGITRYYAQFAVALKTAADKDGAVEVFFAATSRDHHPGAWDLVRSRFDNAHILTGVDFPAVVGGIPRLMDEFGTLVVHYGGGWHQTKHLIPIKRRYGGRLRLVATTHSFRNNSWRGCLMSALQWYLYNRYVQMVVFQCPYVARKFTFARALFKRGKGCVIPLGVMPIFENVSDEMPEVFAENGLDKVLCNKSNFNIVYLAEFRPGKNHMQLTKMLMPLMKRFANVHVLFCGGLDEVITPAVKQMLQSAGLEDRFHIPGVIPRQSVPWLLKHAHCSVVASASETFGHAYIEPMMSGVPVLGTRVGVGEYVIQDYATGFGFEMSSPKLFRQQLEFLLQHERECRQMGANGRELAQSLFSMDKVAEAHLRLYKALAED